MNVTPPIRIDEATGLKLFNTRAAKATDKIAGKGYSPIDDAALKALPPSGAGCRVQRRGTGEVPRVQGGAAGRGRLHRDGRRVLPVSGGRLFGAAGPARGADRRVRDRGGRRRLRRAAAVAQAAARPASTTCGSARRAATSAAPGTGTAIPASPATSSRTAICRCWRRWATIPTMKFASGLRDPRVLPEDGGEVRLLRPLPVPHHRREDRRGTRTAGRWTVHTDRGDAMRARFVDPRERHPDHARSWLASTAWRRSRASRSTPRAGTTTST